MSPARDQLALKTLPVYNTRAHCGHRVSSLAAHAIRVDMSGFTTFTPEQIAAAPQLEPSFEMTLRAADISEDAITGFCVHRIKNAATFAAMDSTPEELSSRSLWHRHSKIRLTVQGGVGQHSQRVVGCKSEP